MVAWSRPGWDSRPAKAMLVHVYVIRGDGGAETPTSRPTASTTRFTVPCRPHQLLVLQVSPIAAFSPGPLSAVVRRHPAPRIDWQFGRCDSNTDGGRTRRGDLRLNGRVGPGEPARRDRLDTRGSAEQNYRMGATQSPSCSDRSRCAAHLWRDCYLSCSRRRLSRSHSSYSHDPDGIARTRAGRSRVARYVAD